MLRHAKRTRAAGLVGATALLATILAGCGGAQDADQAPRSSAKQTSTADPEVLKECGKDPQGLSSQGTRKDDVKTEDAKNSSSNGVSFSSPDAFAISTPNPAATFVGCRVLAQGGTAADATFAAQMMLGLTEPQYSGPGGGAISVYYDASAQKLVSLDGTVNAPSGDVDSPERAGAAGRIGVPRTLEVMRKLHADYGKLDRHQILQPVIDRANEGFKPSPRLVEAVDSRSEMFESEHAESKNYLQRLSDADENSRIKNPNYAETVRRIADDQSVFEADGTDSGRLADDIAGQTLDLQRTEDKAATEKKTKRDEREQQSKALAEDWVGAEEEKATTRTDDAACVDYRGKQVCGNSSPATGFTFVNHALNIYSHLPEGVITSKAQSEETRDLLSDAQRLVMANANTYMGDPTMDHLVTEDYLNEVVRNSDRAKEDADRAVAGRVDEEPEPHKLSGADREYQDFEEEGTSQISVKDKYGNWASTTTTLQKNFGSGIFVHGFFLNNSLDNFSDRKGEREVANTRKALAHPKTMMSPVVMLDNGQPFGVVGSPGGSKIPSYVLKAVVGILDAKLTPEQAVLLPNYGAVSRAKNYIESHPPKQPAGKDRKSEKPKDSKGGKDVATRKRITADSGLSVITSTEEGVHSVSDPRRMGLALGGTDKQ